MQSTNHFIVSYESVFYNVNFFVNQPDNGDTDGGVNDLGEKEGGAVCFLHSSLIRFSARVDCSCVKELNTLLQKVNSLRLKTLTRRKTGVTEVKNMYG